MIRFIYKINIYIYKYYIYYNLMTTTSITSGTDFIGKTLIIGSTCLLYQDYSKVFDFNNNSTNFFISTMFKNTNQKPSSYLRDSGNGENYFMNMTVLLLLLLVKILLLIHLIYPILFYQGLLSYGWEEVFLISIFIIKVYMIK